MKLLISGEGPRDLGACNNAQGHCTDGDFNRGPMAIWLARLWKEFERSDSFLWDQAGSLLYVSERALAEKAKQAPERMRRQRGKKQEAETGLFFSNAQQLGLMAQELAAIAKTPVMAVLFRDADGTRSAPGQIWKIKFQSISDGFASVGFNFGVPMLPKPKSEAWLLCAGKTAKHSYEALEDISGNDKSPKSAKKQWDAFMGSRQTAAQETDWCVTHPSDWQNLLTMPSFKAFYDRFQDVANAILHPGQAPA